MPRSYRRLTRWTILVYIGDLFIHYNREVNIQSTFSCLFEYYLCYCTRLGNGLQSLLHLP